MKYHWQKQQTPKITAKVATQKAQIKLIWQAYQGLIVAAFMMWLLNS